MRELKINFLKPKSSLYFAEQHAMKTYWGVDVKPHAFLDFGNKWN